MKKHLKRIFTSSIIASIAFSSIAFASNIKITKEFELYSKDKNATYDAEEEIKENGSTYKLKSLDYEILEEKGKTEKVVKIDNLKSENAPKIKEIEIDGKKVEFTLEPKKTKYEKNRKTAQYVYEARDPNSFTPENERELIDKDGKPFKGTLESVSKGANYPKAISIDGVFKADVNAKYFYFTDTGTLYPINTAAPQWRGYQNDILAYLNLSPAAYTITGGTWTSSSVNGNTVTKTASFSGTSSVCDYTCTYTNGASDETYTAAATYVSPYKIKAIATYEQIEDKKEGLSLSQKIILTGAGILILSMALASIFYFTRRKKGENK